MIIIKSNNEGLNLLLKIKFNYIKNIIDEFKNNPDIMLYLAKEEELSLNDYLSYTTIPNKNISFYDNTLKKIYTLKNKNH